MPTPNKPESVSDSNEMIQQLAVDARALPASDNDEVEPNSVIVTPPYKDPRVLGPVAAAVIAGVFGLFQLLPEGKAQGDEKPPLRDKKQIETIASLVNQLAVFDTTQGQVRPMIRRFLAEQSKENWADLQDSAKSVIQLLDDVRTELERSGDEFRLKSSALYIAMNTGIKKRLQLYTDILSIKYPLDKKQIRKVIELGDTIDMLIYEREQALVNLLIQINTTR